MMRLPTPPPTKPNHDRSKPHNNDRAASHPDHDRYLHDRHRSPCLRPPCSCAETSPPSPAPVVQPATCIAQLCAALIVTRAVLLDYLDGGLDPASAKRPVLTALLLAWCELFVALSIGGRFAAESSAAI